MATPHSHTPDEHGFWDYTTPGAGGMEGFGADDYARLLDDMCDAGMNSICVLVKWMTTGYRSRLPFLDQHADNPVTESDNALLRDFFDAARRRGVRTWLGACAGTYPVEHIASPATVVNDGEVFRYPLPCAIGLYDLDCPEVTDYALDMYAELFELFPGVDGFLLETEHSDAALPHRIPLYDAWAEENGLPSFDALATPLMARYVDIGPWRTYTTMRRIELAGTIEARLRSAGFAGDVAMLCETGSLPYQISQEVDLGRFARDLPDWICVSYEHTYNKTINRFGMMEMAVEEPKKAGLRAFYLPRGVMTFAYPEEWPLPMTLEESWNADLEDIDRFRPDGVWWFGCGTGSVAEGAHVGLERLRASGFADGAACRRALLDTIAGYRAEERRDASRKDPS